MAQQTINIGAAPDDGTGDPLRDAFDKCNDNFTELYAALVGLLEFKGSTDAGAEPDYPAASKGDLYRVSVAGKIGGAAGVAVEVGDAYYALADNAGGDQATVGASWGVLQANTTGGGGGGATDFTDLGDVPSAYTGAAGKVLAVKGDESGVEFVAASGGGSGSSPVQTDATTNYDVAAADVGNYIRLTNAGAKTVTVRPEATEALPANGEWHFRNAGAGDATVTEGSGVTVSPPAGGTLVVPEGGTVTLKRVAEDEFDLIGVTVAA